MKSFFKRIFILCIAIAMTLGMNISALAAYTTEQTVVYTASMAENVVFSRGNRTRLPNTGSKVINLPNKPVVFAYMVLPNNPGATGTVKVEFKQGNYKSTYYLDVGKDVQYVPMLGNNFTAGNLTVTYTVSANIPLNSISITFGG